MTCRRCKGKYDAEESRACPHCGEPRPRPRPVFLKTSTILISTSEAEGVYRSLEEVPAPLRTRLLECTNGQNSATILIADRKGREEIARASRRSPGSGEPAAEREHPGAQTPDWVLRAMRVTAALIVLALVALVLWAVCARPWGLS